MWRGRAIRWKARLAWRVLCNRPTAFRMMYGTRNQNVAALNQRNYGPQPFGKRIWLAWEIIMGCPVSYRISMAYDPTRSMMQVLDKDQWFYQCSFVRP